MPRVDENRRLILAGAEELENYLNSSQLLWRLSHQAGSLTPGSLLLALKCLRVEASSVNDPILRAAVEQIDRLIQKRQAAWRKRVADEIPYRLRLWKSTLEDYFEEGMLDLSIASQIKNRVIIELLLNEARLITPVIQNQIDQLDQKLRPFFDERNFLWESALIAEFDMTKYWFLYLQPGKVKS